MAIRTRYMVIDESKIETDENGNLFYDILTFPINKFKYTQTPVTYILTDQDVKRFDIFIYTIYGDSYYDDIILYLNNLENKHELYIGLEIILPVKTDIDNFYLSYLK